MATRTRKSFAPIALIVLVVALVAAGFWWRQSRPAAPLATAIPAVGTDAPATASQAAPGRSIVLRQANAQRNQERGEIRKQAMAKRQAASDAMLQKHRTDPVDPKWAPAMEAKLQAVAKNSPLVAADAVPTSLDIQCRSTTCTIEAGLPTRSQGEDFALIYMSSVGSNIKRAFSTNVVAPDGTSHIEIVAQSR